MSIFYDEDWDKAKIVKIFGTKKNLESLWVNAWHSDNGEHKFGGYWLHHSDLKELIRLYDESNDDVKDSELLTCWSCNESLTYVARAENDGDCPFCQAEIELD